MLNYPSFDILQKLYPTVGVKVLKPVFQSEGSLSGNMLINNKTHSEYAFKGKDFDDLYYNILKAQHFVEQRSPKVLLNRGDVSFTSPVSTVKVDDTDQIKTGVRRVWVINDDLVERYRISLDQVKSYTDRGFVAGRKTFGAWVSKEKITAFAAKNKTENMEKLKALAASKKSTSGLSRSDYKGGRRMLDLSGVGKRVLAADVDKRLKEGWTLCNKTAEKRNSVNIGAGRGAHLSGNKRMISAKGEKRRVFAKDIQHFLDNGWTFAANKPKVVTQKELTGVDGRKGINTGTKWIADKQTGKKSRVARAEAEKLIAAGTHVATGPRAA